MYYPVHSFLNLPGGIFQSIFYITWRSIFSYLTLFTLVCHFVRVGSNVYKYLYVLAVIACLHNTCKIL